MTATISPPTTTADDGSSVRLLDLKFQRLCVWSGPVFILVYMTFFVVVAGWVPPKPPTMDATALATWFSDNRLRIQIGQLGCTLSFVFLQPYWLVICGYIRQIERGRMKILYMLQLCVQTMNLVFFTFPSLIWLIATYRPGLSPEIVQLCYDFGWVVFLMPFAQYFTSLVTIGIAVLTDRSARPVFPRWVAYFNFAEVTTCGLGGFMIFVKGGPMAYNGLLGFYMVNLAWFVWIIVMTTQMLKYNRRERELLPQ